MSRRYGEILSPEDSKALDEELSQYWRERKEAEAKARKEESLKRKRARDRRSSSTYYYKTKEELREAKRLRWHEVRSRKRAEREKQKRDAEHAPLFKALNLTETDAQCYYKVAELITTKIVSLLAAKGLLPAKSVDPALAFLSGIKH